MEENRLVCASVCEARQSLSYASCVSQSNRLDQNHSLSGFPFVITLKLETNHLVISVPSHNIACVCSQTSITII